MRVIAGSVILEPGLKESDFRELAQKGVSEFAFIMQPLKIQGGSGSTVSPVAVR